mgnify:CR=1 FL=1
MKKADLVKLGNNIRAERNRLNYTQEDLGNITGILPQHIGRIEKGEIDIRFSTLVSLMAALQIPFDKLYDLKDF